MNFLKTCFTLVCVVAVFALALPDAEAARFGKSKSFGSSPTLKAPAAKTTPPATAVNPQAGGVARSGFGGLMGGLLAGSLLGSLFMGGGFGGVGMFDILLIGLLVYFGFKLFGSKLSRNAQNQAQQARPKQDMWSNLSSEAKEEAPKSSQIEGFNPEDFLKGAKIAFTRLQNSWDKRDLEDIAQFTNEDVLAVIKEQATEDPEPSKTEIIMVNASVLGTDKKENLEEVTVYFDVLLREDGANTNEVKEIWNFQRNDNKSSWKLVGIKQVD